MEVKIGVQHAPRELAVETGQSSEQVEKTVADALSGADGLLKLTDDRGRQILVPAAKLAYVEIGEPGARRVGFGAVASGAGGPAT